MCKRLLLVTTALAMLGGAAQAADIPLKAPPRVAAAVYDWTGFYVGINGGVATGDLDWTYRQTDPLIIQRGDHRTDGGFFGGHVGAQVQFHNNLVLGVEFNMIGSDISGSARCDNPDFRCSSKVDRLWTVGPRAGFALNNVLFYGTGGYASGRVRTSTLDLVDGFPPDFTDVTHHGWFAGGGIEAAIMPNLIAGVEFTHFDLGSRLHTTSIPAAPDLDRNVSTDFNTIRARLSYKFAVPGMSR